MAAQLLASLAVLSSTELVSGIIHMAVMIYNALPNKLKINSTDTNQF
jgi:hypothetical protein